MSRGDTPLLSLRWYGSCFQHTFHCGYYADLLIMPEAENSRLTTWTNEAIQLFNRVQDLLVAKYEYFNLDTRLTNVMCYQGRLVAIDFGETS